MNKKLKVFILCLLIETGCSTGITENHHSEKYQELSSKKAKTEFLSGEVLVKFKPRTAKRFIAALKEKLKVKEEIYTKSIDLYHWKGHFDTEKAINLLNKSPHVLYAEPNYRVKIENKAK